MQAYRKHQEPAVHKLKEPVLDEITHSLAARYGLNFTMKDTSTLWFLCKQVLTSCCASVLKIIFSYLFNSFSNEFKFQEASLLDITDQACGLFTNDEVSLLLIITRLVIIYKKVVSERINLIFAYVDKVIRMDR